MKQIFFVLALLANACLLFTFYLGWTIEDAGSLAEAARKQVSMHFLFALASVAFALLVHAIVLTYFMGTGRWIEETSAAYKFEPDARKENIRLKYRVIPGMVACMLLLIITGSFGAIADPASNMQMDAAATIHLVLGAGTILLNMLVSVWESQQISKNTLIVDAVYQEVLRIRRERGLDVAPNAPRADVSDSSAET
ncbi:MAG: hypothetical protein KDA80_11810 [Planctomycetaceae bacterium]|nr:hypothetical protein [Planctomycetaceae bacterium]